MNTSGFSKEQFNRTVKVLRERAHIGNTTKEDILFYNLARGLPLDRGFSPVKKDSKLRSGARPWGAFEKAVVNLKCSLKHDPYKFIKCCLAPEFNMDQLDKLLIELNTFKGETA